MACSLADSHVAFSSGIMVIQIPFEGTFVSEPFRSHYHNAGIVVAHPSFLSPLSLGFFHLFNLSMALLWSVVFHVHSCQKKLGAGFGYSFSKGSTGYLFPSLQIPKIEKEYAHYIRVKLLQRGDTTLILFYTFVVFNKVRRKYLGRIWSGKKTMRYG